VLFKRHVDKLKSLEESTEVGKNLTFRDKSEKNVII